MDYKKASSTSSQGCGSHSLTTISAKLQSPRYPPLANRTWIPLRIRRRRPSPSSSPKEFHFPLYLLGGFVARSSWNPRYCKWLIDSSLWCSSLRGFLGSLQLSCGCVPQALCKGFVVPSIPPLSGNELASVACSPENKVSLSGIGGLCVTTPLQRRCTSPQKEGTIGIHPCVSGLHSSIISFPYLYLASYLFTCMLVTYRKFT
jgi:hypothetical protein